MLPSSPTISLDNGNMLEPNLTFGSAIFSLEYLPYPDTKKLHQNPALPIMDKEYSTDDNSTTDESVDFSSDEADDESKNSDNDSEQSYM